MPLTPDQKAKVERTRRLRGNEAAAARSASYEEINASEISVSSAQAPVSTPVAFVPPLPEPSPVAEPTRSYIGYQGVKPFEPQGDISTISDYTNPDDVTKQEIATHVALISQYMKEGATEDDAKNLARMKIESLRRARDLSYEQRPAAIQSDPAKVIGKTVFGPSALWEAMKPQVRVTSEEAKDKAEYDASVTAKRQEFAVAAAQQVQDEKAKNPTAAATWNADTLENLRKAKLRALVEPFRPKDTGDAAKDAAQRDQYRNFVGGVAPSLLTDPEFKTTWGEHLARAGTDTAKLLLMNKDQPSGAITESLFGATMRDVAALWRPVITPLRQALTYDVDPEGKPVDTSDIAYQVHQAAGPVAGLLPFQARQTTPDTAATGNWWVDVAKDVRDGQWIGTDLQSLPEVQRRADQAGWHSAPLWVGMAGELMLPATPFGLITRPLGAIIKPALAIRTATHVATEATKGLETAVDLTKAADEASILNTTARHIAAETTEPLVASRTILHSDEPTVAAHEIESFTSPTMQRMIVESTNAAGDVDRTVLLGKIAGHNTAVRAAVESGQTAPEVGKAVDLADSMVDRFIPKVETLFVGMQGSRVAPVVTSDIHSAAYARAAVKQLEAEGVQVDRHLTFSKFLTTHQEQLAQPATQKAIIEDVVRQQTAEALRNKLPSDTMFITPTVIAKRSVWNKISPAVVTETRAVMDGAYEASGAFRTKNGTRTADALLQALGPVRADSSFWKTVVSNLESEGTLTPRQYLSVYNEVLGATAVRTGKAQGVTFTGRLSERAAKLPITRIPPISKMSREEILRTLAPGVVKGIRNNRFTSWLVTPAGNAGTRSPLVVKNWLTALKGEVTGIPTLFRNDLKANQKLYGIEAGFDHTIQEAWAASTATPQDAWFRTVSVFFGPGRVDRALVDDVVTRLGVGPDHELTFIPQNLARIVENIRVTRKDLEGVGLRSPIPTYNAPNYFAAMVTAALEARSAHVVDNAYIQLLGENPEIALPVRAALDPERVGRDVRSALFGTEFDVTGASETAQAARAHVANMEMASTKTRDMREAEAQAGIASREHANPRVNSYAVVEADEVFAARKASARARADLATKELEQAQRLFQEVNERLNAAQRAHLAAEIEPLRREMFNTAGRLQEAQRALDIEEQSVEQALRARSEAAQIRAAQTHASARQAYATAQATSTWSAPVVKELVTLAREQAAGWHTAAKDILDSVVMQGTMGAYAHSPLATKAIAEILARHGIPTDRAQSIAEMLREVVLGPLRAAIEAQARAWGLQAGRTISDGMLALRPFIQGVPSSDLLTMFGKDLSNEVEKLKSATAFGALTDSLNALHIKDNGLLSYWFDLVGATFQGQKRVQAGGLLAGQFLPNPKYHGNNFLTAPFIVALTLDVPSALKAMLEMRTVPQRLFNYAMGRTINKAGVVAFTDVAGRQWTWEMLDDAVLRNNISTSQSGFEFGNTVLSSMMREAQLDPKGNTIQNWMLRQLWTGGRWIDPTGKNVWAEIADQSDNLWRRNVFTTALREGKTEEQAADLARRSLLDYGAVTSAEKRFAQRYLLVYTFRRQMMAQTLAAILRNPNDLSRLIRFNIHSQQITGTWALGGDDTATALWAQVGPTFDEQETLLAGPSNPPVDSIRDLVNALNYPLAGAMGAETWGESTRSAVDALQGQVSQPVQRRILDAMLGSTLEAKDGKFVPPEQVALLMEAGLWPTFVRTFNVEYVTNTSGYGGGEGRRAGVPTYEGVQFRFADQDGLSRYLDVMMGLMLAGVQRNIVDYQKLAMSMGYATPPGMDPKKLGPSVTNAMWQVIGGASPRTVPNVLLEREYAIQKQLKELRTLGSGK